MITRGNRFQIGRFLHLRFEIRDLKLNLLFEGAVQFQISNLEPEMQESSNFLDPCLRAVIATWLCAAT